MSWPRLGTRFVAEWLCFVLVAASPVLAQKHAISHRDHNPKHGGTFFMALDNKHHLEGTLVPPGIFRVYVYDSYTRPLSLDRLRRAQAVVKRGDSPESESRLTARPDGKALEVDLGKVRLPLELILLMRLPGAPADGKPEMFTFPFSHFTRADQDHAGSMQRRR